MRALPFLSTFLIAIVLASSCESGVDGDLNANLPPETFFLTDTIVRPEQARFSSQIRIQWSGNDPDGFVVGYEFSFADTLASPWQFTATTDSIFVLPITEGQNTDDVLFRVRAIDNQGAKDPNPPRLVFPVKNTPPSLVFSETQRVPDSTFNLFSAGWIINDIDGDANLARLELAINDTSSGWTLLPLETRFLSFQLQNPIQGSSSADLFSGLNFRTLNSSVDGFQVGSDNSIILRVTDRAGAQSTLDTLSFFIKPKTSRILVLNDIGLSSAEATMTFHRDLLAQNGITGFDEITISDGETGGGLKVTRSSAFPATTNPTLLRMLAEWDFIYWVSDNLDRNVTFANEILSTFFNEGGRAFITIPIKELEASDPVLNFLNIQAFTDPGNPLATSMQIANRREITPLLNAARWPTLESSQTISNIVPIEPLAGATPLYKADFRLVLLTGPRPDFTGNEVISLINGDRNMIYFGLDLTQINARNNAQELVQALVVEELGFQE